MVYKSFYIRIIIIGLIIIGTAYLIGWIGFNTEYMHTLIFLHILFVLEFIWLVAFVNKTNRMLDSFFSSVHETGTSIGFENLPDESSFKKLSSKLNGITEIIRASRIEKENEHHYLKYLVEHLKTGILTIENDNIDLINKAGLELLGSKKITTLYDLKQFGKGFYETLTSIRTGENKLTQAIVNNEIVDYTGKGIQDLITNTFRTPEKPLKTFSDDPLRILRVIRFSAKYNGKIDPETYKAMIDTVLEWNR